MSTNNLFDNATDTWLKRGSDVFYSVPNTEALTELKQVIQYHSDLYYKQHNAIITDYQFDTLFNLLKQTETAHPEWITADSPTQQVGSSLSVQGSKVQHLVPMLSLENTYNEVDLQNWDGRVLDVIEHEPVTYCIEPKFDGASISLIYENDVLTRAATRGDGNEGEDITINAKQIKSIPKQAAFSHYGIHQIEIRGEALLSKKTFAALNAQIEEDGGVAMANARNAVSGTLRMKDAATVKQRNIQAYMYHVSFIATNDADAAKVPQTHYAMVEMLAALGFETPLHWLQQATGIDEVVTDINNFEANREKLDFEVDGMVVKVNNLDYQEKLGNTSHHPRWAVAYKFKAQQAISTLQGVTFQVGRTGAVTPVAKIKPVALAGVTISSISLHNEDYIKQKDIKIGDTVVIERSGDVIPQIVMVLSEKRTGAETDIDFPTNCTVCNDSLEKPVDEAVWRCINASCKAQVVERMIHYASKDAMDIKNLGEANVKRFFALQLLNSIPDIYKLSATDLQNLEGFGNKSIQNLLSAIERSKSQPLYRLINGLGIRYVGENTAKTLARSIDNLMDLQNYSIEQLQQLPDVGIKVATSIYDFFKNDDNIEMLNQLQRAGVSMQDAKTTSSTQNQDETKLNGKTFLFTGTLPTLKRSTAEDMVSAEGGTILNTVSSKLNYLIVGAEPGSKFEKAKAIPTIQILNEQEFLQLLQSQ